MDEAELEALGDICSVRAMHGLEPQLVIANQNYMLAEQWHARTHIAFQLPWVVAPDHDEAVEALEEMAARLQLSCHSVLN